MGNDDLDAIARAANQQLAQQQAEQAQRVAEEARRKEYLARVTNATEAFAQRLDDTVDQLNGKLERRVTIAKSSAGRTYAYGSRSLELRFENPSEVVKVAQRDVMSVGLLLLGTTRSSRPSAWLGSSGGFDSGVYFLLTDFLDDGSGVWTTCEINDNALAASRQGRLVQTKVAFPSLNDVVKAIREMGVLSTHDTGLHPYRDADFTAMLGTLVQS